MQEKSTLTYDQKQGRLFSKHVTSKLLFTED